MNEIDLKKYVIRTDLITEIVNNKINIEGVKKEQRKIRNIEVEKVSINEEASGIIGRKSGSYITITFSDVTDVNNRESVIKVLTREIKNLLTSLNIENNKEGLIIGLGNSKSTPDSLGPKVINNIIVTKHLFDLEESEEINVSSDYRSVAVLTPGVYAGTGMETQAIINGIIKETTPDFLIVIDSLAASSIERVNKTIQLTDTGIFPGSGVGNTRKELSYETLGIPVIAIGVPTVVDAVTIVSDTIYYLMKKISYNIDNINKETDEDNYIEDNDKMLDEKEKKDLLGVLGSLSEEETRDLIYEVLYPIGYNMMVTPKEIDFVIDKLALIIGKSINSSLHKI